MCLYVTDRLVHKNNGTAVVVSTPCGHCIECLKRRQNDWKLRLNHEAQSWKHLYFFTLTYRDDMLPCVVAFRDCVGDVVYAGSLPECESWLDSHDDFRVFGAEILSTASKGDVQRFMKRLSEGMTRLLYPPGSKSRWERKYFICSEYGPNPTGTKRPHYHGLLFCNEDYNSLKPFFDTWKRNYGRVDFREVGLTREDRSSVANYVSKYCSKGEFESRSEDIDHFLIERAFTLCSKNIGAEWLAAHKQDYLRFVPYTSQVEGDWSEEDFIAFAQKGTDEYLLVMNEIDELIRNIKIYDGSIHRYSMPRYYYDRIFNKVRYDDRIIETDHLNLCIYDYGEKSFNSGHFCFRYSEVPLTFYSKIIKTKRYVPESFLSRALKYRLHMLSLERDRQFAERMQDVFGCSFDEAMLLTLSEKRRALFYREQSAKKNIGSFFTSNMWNHREFD